MTRDMNGVWKGTVHCYNGVGNVKMLGIGHGRGVTRILRRWHQGLELDSRHSDYRRKELCFGIQ